LISTGGDAKSELLSFTVQTIGCVACTPAFRRSIERLSGVTAVTELPITNKFIVVFDASRLSREVLKMEVVLASRRAGFGDKLIFRR
jgi:hypothetical protein